MRVVIFCFDTVEALTLYRLFPSAYTIHNQTHAEFAKVALEAFIENKSGVLITTQRMATDWRAPVGTTLLFTHAFPKLPDPVRIQAEARVLRVKNVEGMA